MHRERALGESSDARKDVVRALRPYERLRSVVMRVEERLNRTLEFGDAAMRAASQLLRRQFGEPPFDEIEPGAVGRREVHMEARPRTNASASARQGRAANLEKHCRPASIRGPDDETLAVVRIADDAYTMRHQVI